MSEQRSPFADVEKLERELGMPLGLADAQVKPEVDAPAKKPAHD